MMRVTPERELVEELAEEIWTLAEMGDSRWERLTTGSKVPHPEEVFDAMRSGGLVQRSGDLVALTPAGREIAVAVIRRHRLAEVLFSQVLALRDDVTNSTACEVEHILTAEVTDSVCAFLGHPPHCPHGKAIPRGACCALFTREIRPLVSPLGDLAIGETARIVFMAPRSRTSLDRVATLGVIPGAEVRLRQKRPSVVLEVGETTVALDQPIAAEIYVRRRSTEKRET